MSKYTWYVAQRKIDGKNIATSFSLRNNQNIISAIEMFPGIITLNACDSKTEAKETERTWNEGYKNNGTYLFG